jgi:hypothetical protein
VCATDSGSPYAPPFEQAGQCRSRRAVAQPAALRTIREEAAHATITVVDGRRRAADRQAVSRTRRGGCRATPLRAGADTYVHSARPHAPCSCGRRRSSPR